MTQNPSALHLRAMWKLGLILGMAGALVACGPITPSPNPYDTGGAGITAHEDHSDRIHSADGTGSSSAAFGAGTVLETGATGETDNAHSPSESNGGQPLGMASASGPMSDSSGSNANAPAANAPARSSAAPANPNGTGK